MAATSTTQLTNNAYDDRTPDINSHGEIVWYGYDGSDNEIFLATPSQTGWGASSTVGEYKSTSDTLNYLFFLMVPVGVLLLWKTLRRSS